MKKIIVVLLCVTLVGLPVACENMQGNSGALTGAGIGAGVGALAGGLINKDDPTRGAIIGGIVGAFAGAMIGHYIDKKKKTAEQTEKAYNYTPDKGTVVNVEDIAMEPNVIKPGQSSKLVINYALLSPETNKSIPVTETRSIYQGNKLLKTIGPAVKNRNAGTYMTEQEITFPAKIPGGAYTLKGTVTAQGKTSTRQTNFTVARIETENGYLYAVRTEAPSRAR